MTFQPYRSQQVALTVAGQHVGGLAYIPAAASSSPAPLVICDPTWTGSDHTREHIPVLMYGTQVPTKFLGGRDTFADIGQTIAKYLALSPMEYGTPII